jgi:hypothetical protein
VIQLGGYYINCFLDWSIRSDTLEMIIHHLYNNSLLSFLITISTRVEGLQSCYCMIQLIFVRVSKMFRLHIKNRTLNGHVNSGWYVICRICYHFLITRWFVSKICVIYNFYKKLPIISGPWASFWVFFCAVGHATVLHIFWFLFDCKDVLWTLWVPG